MTEGVIATGSADYGDYRNRFFHLSMNEEVDLVYLVYLVCLVRWFVWFLSFFEPNQLNKQAKPNEPDRLTLFTTVLSSSLLQNAAPFIGATLLILSATPRNRADSPSLLPCITGTCNAVLIPGVANWLIAVLEEGSLLCEFFVRWMDLNGRSGGYKHSKRSPAGNRRM